MDGPLITASYLQKSLNDYSDVSRSHISIGRANMNFKNTYGKFLLEMIAVFNEFVPNGRVYMSYAFSRK